MEKVNFVRDGGRKLPPGFRFEPTEEEIVFQYLSRKTFSHPLPALVIPEMDVFSLDPWQLAGDSSEDMYFFSNSMGDESERERATASGFWKANAAPKQIHNSWKRMRIVGIRKSFVFYMRSGVSTHWIMHQYCIALSQQNNCLVRIGDWSLCRIFMRKGGTTTQVDEDAHSFSASSSSSPNYDSTIFNDVSSST
ncbi:NAC domain-containing protein 83-like [Salvia miltiorrhiza]|uniref:NAC domain-containing protein 83-like n=1 Tax=Salvia miltiorrhiza TaxID=226208 RepID=UPI0025ACD0E8|nr:NAC domain-containing protein 83-like [Salvia miltiorrhiza]